MCLSQLASDTDTHAVAHTILTQQQQQAPSLPDRVTAAAATHPQTTSSSTTSSNDQQHAAVSTATAAAAVDNNAAAALAAIAAKAASVALIDQLKKDKRELHVMLKAYEQVSNLETYCVSHCAQCVLLRNVLSYLDALDVVSYNVQ